MKKAKKAAKKVMPKERPSERAMRLAAPVLVKDKGEAEAQLELSLSRFATGYRPADGVTQSILGSFAHCRQQCEHSLNGLRPDKPKDALEYGSLTHKLLETWYGLQGGDLQPVPENVLRTVQDAWRAPALERGVDPQTLEKQFAMADATFPLYCRHWAKRDAKMQWVALEEVFDVQSGGHRLRGKTDGIFRVGGKLWIFETKTKSRIDVSDLSDALAFDFQNLFYLTVQEELKGEQIAGVLYNIVRVPGIKLGDGEALTDWAGQIKADAEGDPAHYFHRYECPYSRKEVERFVRERGWKLEDFRRWCRGEPDVRTYRNEAACCGRWNCDFLKLCASGSTAGYKTGQRMFEELA